jgi:hypothetical protein
MAIELRRAHGIMEESFPTSAPLPYVALLATNWFSGIRLWSPSRSLVAVPKHELLNAGSRDYLQNQPTLRNCTLKSREV